jgi:hypothetical protein
MRSGENYRELSDHEFVENNPPRTIKRNRVMSVKVRAFDARPKFDAEGSRKMIEREMGIIVLVFAIQ